MAGSRGTKVEAAFNQSPVLAGCPEELAEERMGAAEGEEIEGVAGCNQGAPSRQLGHPVLGPPQDPAMPYPEEKAP